MDRTEVFPSDFPGPSIGELIPAVVDSQVLAIAAIDQTVINTPIGSVDHAIGFRFVSCCRLQSAIGAA